ncbi:Mannose-binding protein C, partial [Sciurus carolinensis]|nr:Mannose-binding protein C [Sciurus carolinensis]
LNAEENQAIQSLVKHSAFLGMTDKENKVQFVNTTGRRVSYQNWNREESNNAVPGEHCADAAGQRWNDAYCSSSFLSASSLPEGNVPLDSLCAFTAPERPIFCSEDEDSNFPIPSTELLLFWSIGEDEEKGLNDRMWCGREK